MKTSFKILITLFLLIFISSCKGNLKENNSVAENNTNAIANTKNENIDSLSLYLRDDNPILVEMGKVIKSDKIDLIDFSKFVSISDLLRIYNKSESDYVSIKNDYTDTKEMFFIKDKNITPNTNYDLSFRQYSHIPAVNEFDELRLTLKIKLKNAEEITTYSVILSEWLKKQKGFDTSLKSKNLEIKLIGEMDDIDWHKNQIYYFIYKIYQLNPKQ